MRLIVPEKKEVLTIELTLREADDLLRYIKHPVEYAPCSYKNCGPVALTRELKKNGYGAQ
jgi:hypothetical protein